MLMLIIRSTLSSLPLPPPPLTLEDNIGIGLLDDFDNLDFDGENNGDNSPTNSFVAPPEALLVLFNFKSFYLFWACGFSVLSFTLYAKRYFIPFFMIFFNLCLMF